MAGLVGGLARNGQMIIVTFTNEPMPIMPSLLMRGQKSISGWVGGTPEDALEFRMVSGVKPMVEPMVEVFPLETAAEAFGKMMTAKVHFRAVLKMR